MELRVLGPLEVLDDTGVPVDVAGARLKALLVVLGLRAGEIVPTGRIVESVWGEREIRDPVNAVQVLVSKLRRVLQTGGQADNRNLIVTAATGYSMNLAPDSVDAVRFERLAAVGRAGSFAEFVTAKVDKVAGKPANLTFEQAATVPVSAVAAIQAVRDRAHVEPGQHVLVVGGSGGVGRFVVQLVKARGGRVTAVASTSKLDDVRNLGADEVIDYTQQDFADGRHTYDTIIDTGGNRPLSQVRRALAPKGTLVIVGGENDGRFLGGFARNLRAMVLAPFAHGQHLRSLASKENAGDLDALRVLFEEGQLSTTVAHTYPLEGTAAAIGQLKIGEARGKVVIRTK